MSCPIPLAQSRDFLVHDQHAGIVAVELFEIHPADLSVEIGLVRIEISLAVAKFCGSLLDGADKALGDASATITRQNKHAGHPWLQMRVCFQIIVNQKRNSRQFPIKKRYACDLSIVGLHQIVEVCDGLFQGSAMEFAPFAKIPCGAGGDEVGAVG